MSKSKSKSKSVSVSGTSRHGRPARRCRSAAGSTLAAAALLGLAALPGAAQAQSANGAKIYATVCGACHQAQGTGVPGMFPPLTGSTWVTGPEENVVKVILHGLTGDIEVNGEVYSSSMPPFGMALKDADIAAVSTYIRGNFTNKAPPVTVAAVAKLRAANAARKLPWTAAELIKTAKAPAKK